MDGLVVRTSCSGPFAWPRSPHRIVVASRNHRIPLQPNPAIHFSPASKFSAFRTKFHGMKNLEPKIFLQSTKAALERQPIFRGSRIGEHVHIGLWPVGIAFVNVCREHHEQTTRLPPPRHNVANLANKAAHDSPLGDITIPSGSRCTV